jgi:hypothetical protein
MIHNLEVERQRIDEALQVLRRLNRMRTSSKLAAGNEENPGGIPEAGREENDNPPVGGDVPKSS